MANKQIRKRQLEEKLGLAQNDIIKNGFDQQTIDIIWDIVHQKCDGLRAHPLISQDEASWPDWVFFLVVHNTHAAIWAIEEKHLSTVEMVNQDYLTPYDVSECIGTNSVIHRFHVVIREDGRYYVQNDELKFHGKQPEFDVSLYVGTIKLSLRGVRVVMAMIARENYLLLQSDCLGYCKDFVMMYFELIEEELTEDHVKVLEALTVTTNALSAASERSGRQNPTSGWSLRSLLTSTFVQVYIGTVLGGATLFLLRRVLS
ncbi:uncharacterized protein LOC114528410 [Dendronephthya gigantea]|uniref:uncharacterized protein LOC114528410 n=1 Tax=Dendronephthya gigantea TaxID=151771 RepID=UPI00106998D8|nr:uncharacterized protein LOC114528410 [Dendronephthya gigantea]